MKTQPSMYDKLKNRIEYVAGIVLITTIAAFIFSVAQVPEYETQSRALVIQKQDNIDAFTASKSADYIASLLEEAIYSDTFYTAVIEKNPEIGLRFDDQTEKRKKEWANTVSTSVVNDKGILVVKAYDDDRRAAHELGDTIIATLIETASTYHGGGDEIYLRVIDNPSTSTRPVRPNVFLNVFAGVVVGIGLSIIFLLIIDNKPLPKEDEVPFYLHPEAEKSQDMSFLADGHVARQPSDHVISENFDPPYTIKPAATVEAPDEVPSLSQQDEENLNLKIQSWMKKD
ncbi:hypothetical protein ACFL2D_02230 [Patescibacteria group bacterium]